MKFTRKKKKRKFRLSIESWKLVYSMEIRDPGSWTFNLKFPRASGFHSFPRECEQGENELPCGFRNTEAWCITLEEAHNPVITNTNEVLQTVSISSVVTWVCLLFSGELRRGFVKKKIVFFFLKPVFTWTSYPWAYYHEYKGQWGKNVMLNCGMELAT